MRLLSWLFLMLWLASLGLPARAAQQTNSADPLARPVTLPAAAASLETVLGQISQQTGLSLSYSTTRVSLRPVVRVTARHRPARAVLDDVLRAYPISYAVVAGQLVLWRRGDPSPVAPLADASPKPPLPMAKAAATAAVSRPARSGYPATAPQPRKSTAPGPQAADVVVISNKYRDRTGGGESTAASPARSASKPARSLPQTPASGALHDSLANRLPEVTAVAAALVSTDDNVIFRSVDRPAIPGHVTLPPTVARSLPRPPTPTIVQPQRPAFPVWEHRKAQVSLVPFLGSNLDKSAERVNNASINLLAGYAAGVDGVELGGVFNVVRDSVRGAQLAGTGNVAGWRVQGVQAAGTFNYAGAGGVRGWQGAGMFNVTQGALEFGAQTAGLFNVANEVRGVQAAGLFNAARSVRGGVQLAGLVNIADSVSGVSIAPFNFVRHGYHRLEISCSQTWLAGLTLKLGGSAPFYTYFTGVIQPLDDTLRWGLGYGVGSELASRRRLSVTLEAQSVLVNEDNTSWRAFTQTLNLHNQLRLVFGLATVKGGRFRILAGPDFNVMVSQHQLTPGRVGTVIGRQGWQQLNELSADGRTYVRAWIGLTSGIRF